MIPVASPDAEKDFTDRALTEREVEAARSVLAGMTAEEAASEMGVGASTVGSFRQHAYRKLGVAGARELRERYLPAVEVNVDETIYPVLLARGLSQTQAEVLARIAVGRSTAQIARELRLAEGSVSAARAAGYRLLGIHSHEELGELLQRGSLAQSPSRSGHGARVAAIVSIAVALVAAIAALVLLPRHGTTPGPALIETDYGDMPDVTGLSPQDAWDALVDAGFIPEFYTVPEGSRDVETQAGTATRPQALGFSGTVDSPLDPSGMAHPELNHVTWRARALVGLVGMRRIPPGLTAGLSATEARRELEELGFSTVNTSIGGSEDAKETLVVASDPAPGAWALPDEPVTVTATGVVKVPNVLDFGPVEASAELLHAGLIPDPYVREWGWGTDGAPRVIMTEPRPDETASVGDVVQVTYSEKIPSERIEEVPRPQGKELDSSNVV